MQQQDIIDQNAITNLVVVSDFIGGQVQIQVKSLNCFPG